MPQKKVTRSGSSTRRRSGSSFQKKGSTFRNFFSELKDSLTGADGRMRARAIQGILLLGLTLFAAISVISFFIVGSADQSVVANASPMEVLLMKIEVRNWGKIYGAYLAYKLINDFLGIGSMFLIFLLGSFSFKLIGAIKKINIFKRFVLFSILSLWTALTAGMIASWIPYESSFRWGGLYGEVWVDYLQQVVGSVGLTLIVLVSISIIAIFVHSETVDKMRTLLSFKWMRRMKIPQRRKFQKEDKEDLYTSLLDENSEKPHELENEEEEGEEGLHPDGPEEIRSSNLSSVNTHQDKTAHATPPLKDEPIKVVLAKGDSDSQPVSIDINRNGSALFNRNYPDHYTFPSIDILRDLSSEQRAINMEEINEVKRQIIETLRSFKITATPVCVTVGPTVTLYEVAPDSGIKISRIRSLEDDIALSIKSFGGIRIIAPIPGKGTIGIEVPNRTPRTVDMKSLLLSGKFQKNTMELPIAMGRTITDDVFMFDLTKMPHLLIAGATGQGKSVGLNVMITSLLYSKLPSELKFLLIDPKMLEFSIYEGIDKQYLARLEGEDKCIVTDMNKVVPTLNSLCLEMDNRYRLLTEAKVRNVKEYNELIKSNKLSPQDGHKFLPYIVLIVDEFADLIMTSGKEVERPIARIAQKARAAGIHMIIATQRPSIDVITGIIKANFPARIAFKVFSQVDSRTILDNVGANLLVGKGDMLFYQGKEMQRLQCAFVDTPETEQIVEHIYNQESPLEPYELPEYIEEGDGKMKEGVSSSERDPLFEEVAIMVVNSQQGSTSNIQRRFNLGYNRAGRIMDQLEAAGIVSAQTAGKPRQVLIQDEQTLHRFLSTEA